MTLKRQPWLPALVALIFLVGQYGALVHATQHQLAGTPHTPCALCAFSHAAGPTPVMPVLPTAVLPPPFHPDARIQRVECLQPVHLPPSRAPPVFLV